MNDFSTNILKISACKNKVEMMVTVNAIKAFTPSHNLDEGFFVPP